MKTLKAKEALRARRIKRRGKGGVKWGDGKTGKKIRTS